MLTAATQYSFRGLASCSTCRSHTPSPACTLWRKLTGATPPLHWLMWGQCGWQYELSLRIKEVHLWSIPEYKPWIQDPENKNWEWCRSLWLRFRKAQERLYTPALDDVLCEDTGVFFMVSHMWSPIAGKCSQGVGGEHLLSNINGSFSHSGWHRYFTLGISTLYLDSSTRLDHFLPTHLHALPRLPQLIATLRCVSSLS